MSGILMYCPGGPASQTGVAASERYPGLPIETCGRIQDIVVRLATCDGPFIVPIWNSHEGEIQAAEYVWDRLQKAEIKITDLWAKMIDFWYVRRVGAATSHGVVGSVVVARAQCSGFLKQEGFKLAECALTTVAIEQYRKGADWDGALVAPGFPEDDPECEVVSKAIANPNNFTSFVRLIPSRVFNPPGGAVWITGVTMRSFEGPSLGDAEQSFFERLLDGVHDLDSMPRLIFVLRRTAKVGLLFEGTKVAAGDVLDAEEMEAGEIVVHEEAGAGERLYTDELDALFEGSCPRLRDGDFIRHEGVKTCLFACPPLRVYTHGFDAKAVEPVVRFYINKLFQLLDEGAKCTPAQRKFFKRHRRDWQADGSGFMEFERVGATEQ